MKKHYFKLKLLIAMMLLVSATNAQTWKQIGSDIDGEAEGDYSGFSVSLSSVGNTVAIGAFVNGSFTGHVRIYQNNAGVWTQLGNDIDGEVASDYSGYSISLSSDGNTVAIGAYENDGNGSNAGHVRIYQNNAGVWTQLGSDIDGEAVDDYSGFSVSLSYDGSTVAIGAYGNDGNGSGAGHVRIYQNNAGVWTQVGSDIDGEATDDNSGSSVSLSYDGNIVAIGAYLNDGNGSDAGHVRIYQNNAGVWTQIGSDIDGEAEGDNSGSSVSLSSDGNTVAIGAHINSGNGSAAGHVRIYQNNAGVWIQIGSDIDGEAEVDFSGRSVSLSSDGNTVAIGADGNDGNGSNAGHVRIYQNNSGVWAQVGIDIDGEAEVDFSGRSVSLSSDGNTVAIGAYKNDGNGSNAGHVRVYYLCTPVNPPVPDLASLPDVTGDCTATISTTPTATDDCGDTVMGTTITTFPITAPGTTVITWNYEDGNGNISTQTQNVIILNSSQSAINENACNSYTVPSGDETYTLSGTYMDTIPNTAGCDSIITINLTIINSTTSTITDIVCDSYIVPSGDETYTESGIYTDTIPNTVDCDSIITINLTIINSTSNTITETFCDSYTVPSGDEIYTESGTYLDTIPNTEGCDSIITIDLTVYSSYSISETVIIDYGESHTFHDNTTATVSGSHASTFNTVNGCDSTIMTYLTVASYIPDSDFEQALIDLGHDTGEINGYVCADSIKMLTSLDVRDKNISDLTGIQDFTALTTLICSSNQLNSIDVSTNSDLTALSCRNNQLRSIDLSTNPNLTILHCDSNQLISLDVKLNTSLTNLSCSNNQLTSLDMSANELLDVLNCNNNPFTSINVSGLKSLTDLNCSAGELVSIDLNGASSLTTLNCDSNKIVNLDLTGAEALTNLSCNANQIENLIINGASSLSELNCSLNKLVNLDASGATSLTDLTCSSNQLENLNISGATSLSKLNCSSNQLVNLDVSGATALTDLSCTSNQLDSLNVSGTSSLITLDCSQNMLTSLVIVGSGKSDITSLVELDCSNNNLDSLDVSGAASLTKLNCNSNKLTSLILIDSNLKDEDSLEDLDCSYNELEDLVLGGSKSKINKNLIKLNCSYNNLKELNVSEATSLTKLNCKSNKLTSLILIDSNLKDEDSLEDLDCSYNELEDLVLGGSKSKSNKILIKLNCSNNILKSINVSTATSLNMLDCSYNRIVSLNVRNGNNSELTAFNAIVNSDSLCIEVDDELAAISGTGSYCDWSIDASAHYSEDCSSSILGINEYQKWKNVVIYPNPSNNLFNIDLGNTKNIDQIVVTDINGRVVFESTNVKHEKFEINLSNQSKGIYILSIKMKTDVSNYKLIKQ
ncbi:MAG: T9SS type A sorting domain-containing protein [Bacteroidales bacterium]|nr:T9SS type A sorting domain-containing protein [Bacteroidales bacterium]